MKIHLSNFKPKKELPFNEPKEGYYDAMVDGDFLKITLTDGTDLMLKMGDFQNDYFSCRVEELIQVGVEGLRDLLNEEREKMRKQIENEKDQTYRDFEEIIESDATMLAPFKDLTSHILETQSGHYEDELIPSIDIYGLIHGGTQKGSGFNVGCATKYLKRYMSEGKEKSYNPKDLLKAIHFLLFEYDARLNNVK